MTEKNSRGEKNLPSESAYIVLKDTERLKLKSEFDYVRQHGIKYVGRLFLLVIAKAPDQRLRLGVICGLKFDKRAVARNRARRLIKESFRHEKVQISPAYLIFIPRRRIIDKKLQDVQKEMRYLLKKADLWKRTITKK